MCGGCSYWNIDYNTEIQLKKENLKRKLNSSIEIRVILSENHFKLRTRFDFTMENQRMGLYGKDREMVDLKQCDVLHPELNRAYQYLRDFFAKNPLKIKKGSIRIRISEDLSKWGLWLDLANVEIKDLLVEKTLLKKLSEKYSIEIGQKKKRLDLNSFDSDQLKLTDPVPENWFKTKDRVLQCAISSFTQPTWQTADLLTAEILNWLKVIQPERVVEYGSGIGQYTLPLLAEAYKVDVYESDLMAIDFLKMNTKQHNKNLTINDLSRIQALEKTVAVVNPPRSGLQKFTQNLMDSSASHVVYISCYPESLSEDLKVLSKAFEIKDIILVDQFKRTPHYEAGVLLERIK